jgi:hypothetical protein
MQGSRPLLPKLLSEMRIGLRDEETRKIRRKIIKEQNYSD